MYDFIYVSGIYRPQRRGARGQAGPNRGGWANRGQGTAAVAAAAAMAAALTAFGQDGGYHRGGRGGFNRGRGRGRW